MDIKNITDMDKSELLATFEALLKSISNQDLRISSLELKIDNLNQKINDLTAQIAKFKADKNGTSEQKSAEEYVSEEKTHYLSKKLTRHGHFTAKVIMKAQ